MNNHKTAVIKGVPTDNAPHKDVREVDKRY